MKRVMILSVSLGLLLSGCASHQFQDPELRSLKQSCMALDFAACSDLAHTVRARRQ